MSGAWSCALLLLLVAVVIGGIGGGLPVLLMGLTHKACPWCRSLIVKAATKCPRCHEWLDHAPVGH